MYAAGHWHYYESLWPAQVGKTGIGGDVIAKDFVDPSVTVHVTSGELLCQVVDIEYAKVCCGMCQWTGITRDRDSERRRDRETDRERQTVRDRDSGIERQR